MNEGKELKIISEEVTVTDFSPEELERVKEIAGSIDIKDSQKLDCKVRQIGLGMHLLTLTPIPKNLLRQHWPLTMLQIKSTHWDLQMFKHQVKLIIMMLL